MSEQGHSPRPSLSLSLFLSLLFCFPVLRDLRLPFGSSSLRFPSPRYIPSHRLRFRSRVPSKINVSRSPGLSPGIREIHIHDNTQCHNVELLPVGKEQKLSLRADVPRTTTLVHHQQPIDTDHRTA